MMSRWIVGTIPSFLLIFFTNFILWLNAEPSFYPNGTYPITFIVTNLLLFLIQIMTCSALHLPYWLMLGVYCITTITLILFNVALSTFNGMFQYTVSIILIYLINCFFELRNRIIKK